MPATTKVPLGATTLNRKWYLDVNTGTTAVPVWTGVFGVTEFQPALDPTLQDDSDFDGEGYKSQVSTAIGWSASCKVRRGVLADTPTAYDPGQEYLRLKANETGVANVAEVRFYEMEEGGPRVEAYQGFAAVGYSDDGGGMDALSTASVTLTGRGKRNSITHPDAA